MEPQSPSKPARINGLYVLAGVAFLVLLIAMAQGPQRYPARDAGMFSDWIGKPAPDMDLMDLEGNRHRISALRGKTVFVVFWSTGCPPCLAEMPALRALYDSLPRDQFEILSLTGDEAGFLKKRGVVERLKMNFPVISYTGQVEKIVPPYRHVNLLPTLMVIGPEGKFETFRAGAKSETELLALAKGEGT